MTIRSYYIGVLAKFVECAQQSKFTVTESTPTFSEIKSGRRTLGFGFSLNTPLTLKLDLPAGSSLAKALGEGELWLLVLPKERYRKATDFEMLESVVEVAYVFYRYAGAPRLLVGCHYDYQCEASGEPRAGHPLFHVQMTNSLFELDAELQRLGVVAADNPVFPQMRLPTAHMSFTAALISIAADNFLPPEFLAFLKDVRERSEYPYMTNAKFVSRMDQLDWRMRSCAWYPNLVATPRSRS